MDERGLPPTQDMVRTMANLLLSHKGEPDAVGLNWVSNKSLFSTPRSGKISLELLNLYVKFASLLLTRQS
jgi:hypothetical protein